MRNQIRRVILFAVEYKKQSTGITVSSLYSHKQKNRCVVVYPAYKEHLHYTYEWLVKKKKTLIIEAICLLLHPSLKIPPCLIRTRPPHMKYACHWLRPKVFKLGRIGCGRLRA